VVGRDRRRGRLGPRPGPGEPGPVGAGVSDHAGHTDISDL